MHSAASSLSRSAASPRPIQDRSMNRATVTATTESRTITVKERDVAAERRTARADDAQAPGSADVLPVDDHRLQHDGQCQRRDGEEDASQAQRKVADAEPEQGGDEPAREDQHRERRSRRLDEEDGGVRPEREEGRRAEVDVAGVAAEDVPRGGDDDILEHNVPREVDVLVHAERGDDDPGPDDGQADEERAGGPRHHLPKSPAGRTASATRRMPNDTASDQEGPKKVAIRLSATPRMTAATSVPATLPMPPRTVIANMRPM